MGEGQRWGCGRERRGENGGRVSRATTEIHAANEESLQDGNTVPVYISGL